MPLSSGTHPPLFCCEALSALLATRRAQPLCCDDRNIHQCSCNVFHIQLECSLGTYATCTVNVPTGPCFNLSKVKDVRLVARNSERESVLIHPRQVIVSDNTWSA